MCTTAPPGEALAINSYYVNSQQFTSQTGEQVIATATPEPGTAVLWLAGIGLMIVMRKRLAQLLRLDTGTHRSLTIPAHH
jgi:hypothetical protein